MVVFIIASSLALYQVIANKLETHITILEEKLQLLDSFVHDMAIKLSDRMDKTEHELEVTKDMIRQVVKKVRFFAGKVMKLKLCITETLLSWGM